MRVIIPTLGLLCLAGVAVSIVVCIIQTIRKKKSKTAWGLAAICMTVGFIVCIILSPSSPPKPDQPKAPESTAAPEVSVPEEKPTEQPVSEPTPTPEVEKTEAEKFAEANDISVELAESLETVLTGMELTDKSRVGVFHYDLSDIYDWEQVEDWAEGQRYSAWMAQEHIFYFYVKEDTVVGVRNADGSVFYSEGGQS